MSDHDADGAQCECCLIVGPHGLHQAFAGMGYHLPALNRAVERSRLLGVLATRLTRDDVEAPTESEREAIDDAVDKEVEGRG